MNKELLDKIDDYLAERLSAEECDAFEERLLTDSALRREVQEQIALRDGMRAESKLLLSEPPLGLSGRLHRLLLSPTWAYGATAGLVLAIVIGLTGQPSAPLPASQEAVIRNVELPRSGEDLVISVPADKVVVLSIDAYGLNTREAGLRISRNNEMLTELTALNADDQDLFNVVVGPFKAGDYRIDIQREDGEEIPVRLEVRKE